MKKNQIDQLMKEKEEEEAKFKPIKEMIQPVIDLMLNPTTTLLQLQ